MNAIIASNLPLWKQIVLLRDAYSVWWWKQNETDEIRTTSQCFYGKYFFKLDVPCSNILTDVYISLSTDWWSLSVKLFIQNQNPGMRAMKMCQWFWYLSPKNNDIYIVIYIVSLCTCAYSNGLRFEEWLAWHLTQIWTTCLNWNPTMCKWNLSWCY